MISIKIFIVNGKGFSGKSTVENMIAEIAAAHGKKVEILSTIDYVKEVAKGFGWDGSKEPKDRKMLSDLKDILTEWNELPHKIVCDKIENLMLIIFLAKMAEEGDSCTSIARYAYLKKDELFSYGILEKNEDGEIMIPSHDCFRYFLMNSVPFLISIK